VLCVLCVSVGVRGVCECGCAWCVGVCVGEYVCVCVCVRGVCLTRVAPEEEWCLLCSGGISAMQVDSVGVLRVPLARIRMKPRVPFRVTCAPSVASPLGPRARAVIFVPPSRISPGLEVLRACNVVMESTARRGQHSAFSQDQCTPTKISLLPMIYTPC
jgi:hypothetical protein